MRDLIISIICMLVLIIPWAFYDRYAHSTVDACQQTLEVRVIPAIERQDWEAAKEAFNTIRRDWKKYRKISAYFMGTDDLNEITGTISKTHYYIKMKDDSNSSGEAAYLKNQFKYLYENETPAAGNVF